jgi:chemotaxis protein methyltransferase CheR
VSLVTTHHTYFFREFSHFEYLLNKALPVLIPIVRSRADKKIRIWSAACSRGQEAFSLAMYLDFHLKKLAPELEFEIYGTDVDPESVAIAKNAVYPRQELKEVPMTMLGDHWIRGTGEIAEFVKAKNSLRKYCNFETGNLFKLEPTSNTKSFDIIFCRNVFIYFNNDQIKQITAQLLKKLSPHGYLFLGISESISQLALPVRSLGPSVYTHVSAPEAKPLPQKSSPPPVVAQSLPKPIRVVCVDDSGSILTLLKRMLTLENGFEVIGTAANGKIASEMIPKLKPDVVTLDIHMPEMTGIEYLKGQMNPQHPPVVMITSVSREDSELASQALSLGASDYVEKPSLNNITERGEEIRSKLKCALQAKFFAVKNNLNLDRSFQKSHLQLDPNTNLLLISFQFGDRSRVASLIKEFGTNYPSIVLWACEKNFDLNSRLPLLEKDLGKKISLLTSNPTHLQAGSIYLTGDLKSLPELSKGKKVSAMILGECPEPGSQDLMKLNHTQLLIEDLGGGKGTKSLHEVATDIVPVTSFSYLAQNFLNPIKK